MITGKIIIAKLIFLNRFQNRSHYEQQALFSKVCSLTADLRTQRSGIFNRFEYNVYKDKSQSNRRKVQFF